MAAIFCVQANGPKVRWLAAAVAALPARFRAPSGPNFRVRTGVYPQRGTRVRVCVCTGVWCVRVCKPRQARPRISRQPICVERAVNVGAQLSS